MEITEKVKELNGIMCDENLTVAERQAYVDTLAENEMRNIFKEMMTAWWSKDNN